MIKFTPMAIAVINSSCCQINLSPKVASANEITQAAVHLAKRLVLRLLRCFQFVLVDSGDVISHSFLS